MRAVPLLLAVCLALWGSSGGHRAAPPETPPLSPRAPETADLGAYDGEELSGEARSVDSPEACGVERWSVKTGTDADAGLVDLTSATLSEVGTLVTIPKPSSLPSNSRVAPTETTVFQVYATLTKYKLEDDSDYHLVLDDGLGHTMIAEIASSGCVGSGSPFAAPISNARAEFDAVLTATTSFKTADIPVLVTGVGFFDFAHGQTGLAPNCIELHPILDIVFYPEADFTLSKSPSALSLPQGGSGEVTVTAAVAGGFSAPLSLSASGLPAGASALFTPPGLPAPGAGSSTLTLAAGAATPPGTYPVTVTASGGGKSHTTTVSLVVTVPTGVPEVSGAMAAVPFTLAPSGDALRFEFEFRGTSGLYHLYGASGRAAMDAGSWTAKVCDLQHSALGAWWTDGATACTWTLTDGASLPLGQYVVVLESDGTEGPYGYRSDGSGLVPDADRTTAGDLGCAAACAAVSATITGVTPAPAVALGTAQTFGGTGTGQGALAYEWDFHYDWSSFDAEATGAAPTYTYASPGDYTVALRVTDSCATPHQAVTTVAVSALAPCSPPVVISRVYGGGGNSGAYWKSDFVELHNRSAATQSLAGWSVQYAATSGTTWQTTALSGSVAAGGYFLVQEATGSGGSASLPAPDATGTINLSQSSGKVALVSAAGALSGSCPTGAAVQDLVGFGTANCYEGSAAAGTLSATTAASRGGDGCTDTGDNAADFSVGTTDASTPPRNAASAPAACSCL